MEFRFAEYRRGGEGWKRGMINGHNSAERATQKINIKLLLSEPTKIKFQKAFPSPFWEGVGWVEVGKGSSLRVNEHCSEKETILFIGSKQERTPGAASTCHEC